MPSRPKRERGGVAFETQNKTAKEKEIEEEGREYGRGRREERHVEVAVAWNDPEERDAQRRPNDAANRLRSNEDEAPKPRTVRMEEE